MGRGRVRPNPQIREGGISPAEEHLKTVFIYGHDTRQQRSFDSPVKAWLYSVENKEREKAMRADWYESRMTLVRRLHAEHRIWKRFKEARSPGQVRSIFRDSHHLKTKYQGTSIQKYADKIAAALRSKDCPKSDRPSSDERFLLYLARVMAGIWMGYEASTAVRILRTSAHHKICPCKSCRKKREVRDAFIASRIAKW
jgi:hypothetical protein